MAIINKDFRVKNGLVVEGTTATVNGHNILLEGTSDSYIIGLIGGSATSNATPNSVVLRDGSANFAVHGVTFDDGAATSSVYAGGSDLTVYGHNNLYLNTNNADIILQPDGQAKIWGNAIATETFVTNQGYLTIVDAANTYITPSSVAAQYATLSSLMDYTKTSDLDFTIGNYGYVKLVDIPIQYTDADAVNAVANVLGNGIEYTGTFDVQISNGLEFNGANQIQINRTTVDTWYDANGAASTVQGNLDTHTNAKAAHGVISDIVGVTDTQTLENKTLVNPDINGEIQLHNNSGQFVALITVANDELVLDTDSRDIVLNPEAGKAYLYSASADNEIATHAYVDSAVSGLTWKDAVHLLASSNVDVLNGWFNPAQIDGHSAPSSPYRVLLTAQSVSSENGIWVYDPATSSWSRSTDADAYSELIGAAVYVMEGTQYGSTSWVQSNHYLTDFNNQSWTQFSGQGTVTAGTGITVNGLQVSVDRTTVDPWYDAAGTASSAVTTHNNSTSGVHGVAGNVVGTTDTQTLTNKTLDAPTITGAVTLDGTGDFTISSDSNIVINPTTTAYLDSATAGNEIATQGYVDNAVNGVVLDISQAAGAYIDWNAGSSQYDVNITDVATGLNTTFDAYGAASTAQTNAETFATNAINALNTDAIEEGVNNLYYTTSRAETATKNLLTSANLTNITITDNGQGLTITAENGVADSTTSDLAEGSNLYFTNQRVLDAVNNSTITPAAVEINNYRKEEATQQYVQNASTVNVHSFAYPYESVKYLVRVVGWDGGVKHSQITEILMTVDGNNNIAMTEYGNVHTSTNPLATFSASHDVGTNSNILTATTSVAGCEIIAAATMLSWAD